jgi:hypothetical protein
MHTTGSRNALTAHPHPGSGPVWGRTRLQAARALGIAVHPVVSMAALVFLVSAQGGGEWHSGLRRTGAVSAGVLLPVLAFCVFQVRSGRWANVDASSREERPALFGVVNALLAAAAAALYLRGAPGAFVAGVCAALALASAAWILNRRIKLSLHLAFGAYAATALLASVGSAAAIVLVPALVALGWARMEAKRHSLAEVVGGAGLGVATGLLWIAGT